MDSGSLTTPGSSLGVDRDEAITLTREEVGLCIDAVAILTRANDVDSPYPALLRKLQEAYRGSRGPVGDGKPLA